MLKANLERIFSEIKNGNNLGEEITLVGATKTVSVDIINQAVELGLKIVAENKVQEFRDKYNKINNATHHFIGHLQTNKVKYLVGKVDVIHSVDTLHLAEEINKCAKKLNVTQKILLEVNVGNELSKSGFEFECVDSSYNQIIASYQNVKVVGLMAMLPLSNDQTQLSSLILKMRKLYDQLKARNPEFTYLSIGTSGDYKIAIANGSNTIRLGRNIFGERNYGEKL